MNKTNSHKIILSCSIVLLVALVIVYTRHNKNIYQAKSDNTVSSTTTSSLNTIAYAEDLNNEEKYQDALNILDPYLITNPNDINAMVAKGNSLFGLGQCHNATVIISSAMEMAHSRRLFLAEELSSSTLQLMNYNTNKIMQEDRCD